MHCRTSEFHGKLHEKTDIAQIAGGFFPAIYREIHSSCSEFFYKIAGQRAIGLEENQGNCAEGIWKTPNHNITCEKWFESMESVASYGQEKFWRRKSFVPVSIKKRQTVTSQRVSPSYGNHQCRWYWWSGPFIQLTTARLEQVSFPNLGSRVFLQDKIKEREMQFVVPTSPTIFVSPFPFTAVEITLDTGPIK